MYRILCLYMKKDGKVITSAEILQDLYTAATLKMSKAEFPNYWKSKQLHQNFQAAKDLLENAVTLTFPDPANPLALSCDASDKAIGAVLEEFQEGSWRPVGFWSKHLSKAKQDWSCFRRELLAIQAGIRNFLPDMVKTFASNRGISQTEKPQRFFLLL